MKIIPIPEGTGALIARMAADDRKAASAGAPSELQAHEARCSVASGSADGFLQLLAGVVEAERLVVAGLKPEMPCRKMHENRHRAFREALSMATAYFQPNDRRSDTEGRSP